MPGTRTEITSVQKHAKGILYKELQGDQATTKATLDAMEQSTCVHLACHASQNTADPTQSGFHLHDGVLSLAAVAGKSFKNKELAFLSACQTATGDKQLPDEAVHLAAGMLAAGYPSVIATMWSIQDIDAPLVADRVYAQLIRGGRIDNTEAAKALHAAVGALRTEVGDMAFTRWVPYIHMGA